VLSIDTIRAAQDNDLAATADVIDHMESRVNALAGKAAQRMAPHGGHRFYNYRDEFLQVARLTVWEALSRFTDDNVESFERFMYVTVSTALQDAVRNERNVVAGADENAMKTFATMVEAADGDVYEAEKLSQTLPPAGRRLSKDRANAARLAWQGHASLDQPVSSHNGSGTQTVATLADTIAVTDEEPDGEIRPKVGHGAALEALQVLNRYASVSVGRMTPGEFAANLPKLVESLEDVVTLPRDPQTRRYVLEAMGVLAAAVSTSGDGDLAEDLKDVSDDRRAESAEKHERVHNVLDSMGEGQRVVLVHSFGIKGAADFGWGDTGDIDGLCGFLGMTPVNLRGSRSKARKTFAKRYVGAVAVERPDHAKALEAAAAEMLTNRGRK
jgi:RNA polymerase sigma factor (sigma-70 family)